jgi:hypothetical protein
MSWAGLASNETISFTNLQDGVNTGQFGSTGTSIPVSNEQITKGDVPTYVNIYTGYTPYAAKASNQLVVKSDLVTTTTTTTTTTVASYAYQFDLTGYNNSGDACLNFTNNYTVYAAESSAISVTRFFTDAALTNPFSGAGSYYAWDAVGNVNGTVDSSGYTNLVTFCT